MDQALFVGAQTGRYQGFSRAWIDRQTGTEVWRTMDGTSWAQANADGFGHTWNCSSTSVAVFGEQLYVGTYTCDPLFTPPPCQVWRTDSAIFADGFESGDTSAWSGTVP